MNMEKLLAPLEGLDLDTDCFAKVIGALHMTHAPYWVILEVPKLFRPLTPSCYMN